MTWPSGHFYSPIPSQADVERAQTWASRWRLGETAGISMNESDMLCRANILALSLQDFRLSEKPGNGRLYGWENGQFNSGDAGVLSGMVAHLRPRQVIEVGAGFSTACILDAATIFQTQTSVVSIEPFPDRLASILSVESTPCLSLRREFIQDFPLGILNSLVPGDILFIDSSHVAKAGSDVLFEIFEMIPRVPAGVFIHFHDILPGFEYPRRWLDEGRYWSEAYLLRALLMFNQSLEVWLWPAGLGTDGRKKLLASMPVMENRIGGSIWLRVVRH